MNASEERHLLAEAEACRLDIRAARQRLEAAAPDLLAACQAALHEQRGLAWLDLSPQAGELTVVEYDSRRYTEAELWADYRDDQMLPAGCRWVSESEWEVDQALRAAIAKAEGGDQ